ncbi:unnamed protein product [Pedinophyceae sp. YPF-701]|nr:unnamed protein product [Pedinophyceae sp. YPF-701]
MFALSASCPAVAPARRVGAARRPTKVRSLEAELDVGHSVKALRRFNDNLAKLDASNWQQRLRPVFNELAHNLETFNPAFTAVVLKVQMTIGASDYDRRDAALQNLIQPLAGEYGLNIGEELGKTHRRLFAEWYESVMGEELSALLAERVKPVHSERFFAEMMRDITNGGNRVHPLEQASYAIGYNLAIEYLADYEKTWMLDSFRAFDKRVLSPLGRDVEYTFLVVHAEHECEHAAIGHAAATEMVPETHMRTVREAMHKHDRDMGRFYDALADMLE